MNKRGYIRTIEAIIALFIVLGVVVTIANQSSVDLNPVPREIKITQDSINSFIQNDENSREAILNQQNLRIDSVLMDFIPENSTLDYHFLICDIDYCPSASNLPQDRSIYVSNLIISSTHKQTGHGVFKLYLWRKLE